MKRPDERAGLQASQGTTNTTVEETRLRARLAEVERERDAAKTAWDEEHGIARERLARAERAEAEVERLKRERDKARNSLGRIAGALCDAPFIPGAGQLSEAVACVVLRCAEQAAELAKLRAVAEAAQTVLDRGWSDDVERLRSLLADLPPNGNGPGKDGGE